MNSPQSKGGVARAKSLTTEARREIAAKAAQARWAKIHDPTALPVATFRGPLTIGNATVQAYRLSDGRRVISKKGMADVLALKSTGGNAFLRSLTRPGVRSQIEQDAWEKNRKSDFFPCCGSGFRE